MTLYVGGGGDNIRYAGRGDGDGDGDVGGDVGRNALFSLGSAVGDWTRGAGDGEDMRENEDEVWHSLRRCWCNRFFDENTFSECLQDRLSYIISCVC